MDSNNGLSEVQYSERSRDDLSDIGLTRVCPLNPHACSKEYLLWLWERISSQDYAFDDFSRGNMKMFLEGLLDPASLHFVIDKRGYIVIRNLKFSDNPYIHYVIWDRDMKFNEILQCGYEVVNFLFATLKVARISAAIPAYNGNAAKFATMLNFKFEGEMRNAILSHELHHNVRLYGLLKQDWLTVRYNHARRTKTDQFVNVNNNGSTSLVS